MKLQKFSIRNISEMSNFNNSTNFQFGNSQKLAI